MKRRSLSSFIAEGVMHANPLTVRLVGLCPALLACGGLDTAFTVSVCTLITLTLCAPVLSLSGKLLDKETGALSALFITCGVLGAMELVLQAYMPDLAGRLGICLPLVAVSGITQLYCGKFAIRNNPLSSAVNGFCGGLGYGAAVMALALTVRLARSVLLISSPAGAFICLGLIAALLRFISGKRRDSYDT